MAQEKHIITDSTTGKSYQLPVPPSSWEITDTNNVSTTSVLGLGQVINGSEQALRTWTIQSIFPDTNYGFIPSKRFMNKWDYVELFTNFKNNKTELIYTISDTNIYIPCIISNIKIGEQDSSGDIVYQLDFVENKGVQLADKLGTITTEGYVTDMYNYFWEVKQGDTVFTICRKAYGDSSKYKQLLEKNHLKNPSQVKVGMTLWL